MEQGATEFVELGFEKIFPVSAIHGTVVRVVDDHGAGVVAEGDGGGGKGQRRGGIGAGSGREADRAVESWHCGRRTWEIVQSSMR